MNGKRCSERQCPLSNKYLKKVDVFLRISEALGYSIEGI